MTLTSRQMSNSDAVTVLTQFFGSSKENARELLVKAYDLDGKWTETPVVQAKRIPSGTNGGSLFYIRYKTGE